MRSAVFHRIMTTASERPVSSCRSSFLLSVTFARRKGTWYLFCNLRRVCISEVANKTVQRLSMMASIGQTSTSIQYSMRTMLSNQPLDFSTPPPSMVLQPSQPEEILDLCVRRSEPITVKPEATSPAGHNHQPNSNPQSVIQHPITILQQHLMQTVPRLPLREDRMKAPESPEYCSTSSERSEPSRISPQNLGLLVAGFQQYPMMPSLPQMLNTNNRSKPTRPFKAYPKDPLSLSVGVSSADSFLGHASNEAYSEFRRRMLDQVQSASSNGTNSNKARSNMKRPISPEPPTSSDAYSANGIPSSPEEGKDAAYWERRRKNNEAAKRSRDARRHKEDEIAIRAAFLEQENMKLKYELAAMRNETAKLRCLLYNS